MSTVIFLVAVMLFTGAILCGVCYGVAIRDYRQWHELGHSVKSPICAAAKNEAGRFGVVCAVAYVLGIVALAGIFWHW